MREKFPEFSTNSSMVINRKWLFSLSVAFLEMLVTATGNWTRPFGLNKILLGAGLPQLWNAFVLLWVCRARGGKSPIFSALWRIMKYLGAHGDWEHLPILGIMGSCSCLWESVHRGSPGERCEGPERSPNLPCRREPHILGQNSPNPQCPTAAWALGALLEVPQPSKGQRPHRGHNESKKLVSAGIKCSWLISNPALCW